MFLCSALKDSQQVSIHAPARGATKRRRSLLGYRQFQFTRPRGARPTVRSWARARPRLFQFTRPRGARPSTARPVRRSRRFNSRAREGRDRRLPKDWPQMDLFQFTRPRGARRRFRFGRVLDLGFQFTRPRGARPRRAGSRSPRRTVSIHAPARGATHYLVKIGVFYFSFNSRAREGRDDRKEAAERFKKVSIHAPARGATVSIMSASLSMCFNSRAREGRDITHLPSGTETESFNSRAREGRDATFFAISSMLVGFNSRAREGRDREVL